ncbi:MAG: hypothetical protein A2857_06260 [Candidatus Levybacteria bacterium RIFCSPHIGHO2_01_FULL_36_15]|nr:MAG: hypothetical protein A2857_06260 [Candidatus Levybacteria bacterium RIFCSPHIGHO2_01_FULL_36_15]
MVKLSIIILTYNSSHYIKECVASIFSFYSREMEKGEFELIIFDNASSDDTIEILKNIKDDYRDVKVFRNEKNLGFAGGMNKAVLHSNGKLILFINSDTVVNDRNIIRMVNLMEMDEKIGVLGGQMLDSKGIKELSAGRFYNLMNVFLLAVGFERIANVRFSPEKNEDVDFVSGGFMMVRKDVFISVGEFDENFFMYVEDMELCFNIKKSGFKIMFYPYAKIKHHKHGSSSRSFAVVNIYKGILYFYRKHKSRRSYFMVKSLLEVKASVAIFIGIITQNDYLKQTYRRSLEVLKHESFKVGL